MASTYVNDLRLNELGTGDASGTWGTITNLNLELIGEGLSYGTQDCFTTDANATTTVADGASDPARSMYFKVTSSATLTATRTLTIAPNTVSRLQFIENATTGGQSINISQGSGANVTIPSGATKAVYLDGAGSGAAVTDAFADLNVGTIDATTLQIGGTSITATATELNYNDISTLGAVTASKTVTADSSGFINFADNQKLRFGAGADLQIYHDSLNSYIDDAGTGALILRGNSGIDLQKYTGDTMASFIADGAVNLYHDNALKLVTKSDGVDITGELQCDTLDVDGASDFTGNMTVNNSDITVTGTGNRAISVLSSNALGTMEIGGATGAFIDLKTPSSDDFDMRVQGDGGSGGSIAIAGGSFSVSGGATLLNAVHSGAVTLYHNGSDKLVTKSDGVDITGELQSDSLDVDGVANISGRITATDGVEIPDNKNLYFGAGQDLVIFHDGVGNGSYINESGSGNLFITGTNILLKNTGSTATYASFTNGGAVDLYHNGNVRLATTSSGISVTGSGTSSNISVSVADDGSANAPDIFLYRNSASPAANDGIGNLTFRGNDTASNDTTYASIEGYIASPTNGSEQGRISFFLNHNNSINEEFRMESDGDFHADGDVIAFSTTVSDERLKTDIEKIENATDKVSQLNGYTFTYKADGKKSAGVIAQEVEKVLPSAVSEKELPLKTDDGVAYKTVQYDQIIGLLIESIKELKQEINELKGK